MSQENDKSYIVSNKGPGGKFFRALRYIRRDLENPEDISLTPIASKRIDGVQITTKGKSSPKGILTEVWARPIEKPSSPKVKIAVFQPSGEDNFERDLDTIPTTTLSPVDYALSKLTQILRLKSEDQERPPLEKFKKLLITESIFPFQNIEATFIRLEQKIRDGLPFKMGCFVCLNTKCTSRDGLPVFYLGQDEKRLTTPKLTRRTQQLISLLDETTVSYRIDILIANTDIYDVNGDWLGKSDQSGDIYAYQRKLSPTFSSISPKFEVKLWSDVQAPYEYQYKSNFDYVLGQYTGSNADEVLINIAKRKQSLMAQGVPDSSELDRICRLTSERNFALYGAQGPILNEVYDLVIMADPEPERLCEKQSLIEPDVRIWCPYPG